MQCLLASVGAGEEDLQIGFGVLEKAFAERERVDQANAFALIVAMRFRTFVANLAPLKSARNAEQE